MEKAKNLLERLKLRMYSECITEVADALRDEYQRGYDQRLKEDGGDSE